MLSLPDENIGDQKDKTTILLRASQIPHPSIYWSMFSLSPCKSSLFLDLLVCNQKRGNFPCFFCLCIFLFFSLWLCCYLHFCLTLLEYFELLQAHVKTEYSMHKNWAHTPSVTERALAEGSIFIFLSDQVSCNHKIWQAWNQPSKHLNGNVIKLATRGNMYLFLRVHVYILDQQRITRFEADHFIIDYWSS